jgi:hypothetical protein
MKNQYEIKVKLSEDLMKKLIYVSEAEGRTPNNQFIFMLRNNIQYFERTKGKIPASELAKIDVSAYMDAPADKSDES